ncbi:50S ribosomal protein L13 [Patescibacteria group bacterium]|nr:50S ribosomal protein L13 [Patescibacteria group bacterium]MBU1016455.1 50S ribosomal protein L13 [Patescibacteria group bacterium]MBU1684953.1 50S ribosomal protein L13 [Patescibacteria group bacterium]MBU1939019.1 50S ribosomal protein L13 [Patescibacteria group bacterium]
MTQKTFTPKSPAKADRKWYLVDAADKVVGRLATEIAVILRGKNKANFTHHLDMGDYVVIINCEKVRLTGSKESQKEYIHHTGYLGHLRRKPFATVKEKNPKRILTEAVAGMVPSNRLKKFVMAKLYVYAGAEHPHAGQNPITLNI